ncbi:hypothetical protein [Aminobacterium mobile]|uniref:hypothetical protein n=1 Tax=Aminobacterium mobile TaxID=81467 RepID=UPI000465280A|nr:hypothetical protein [Aminobacterium mobile]
MQKEKMRTKIEKMIEKKNKLEADIKILEKGEKEKDRKRETRKKILTGGVARSFLGEKFDALGDFLILQDEKYKKMKREKKYEELEKIKKENINALLKFIFSEIKNQKTQNQNGRGE